MRAITGTVLLVCAMAMPTMTADAQRARTQTLQRQEVSRVQVQSVTVREALQDDAVQAEMRDHVRNIDTRAAARRAPTDALTPLRIGREFDQPDPTDRLLSDAELSALANPEQRSGRATIGTVTDRAVARAESASPILRRPSARPSGPGSIARPPQPYLDVQGFADDLHAALENSVQGYEMRMRRNGQTIYTLQWNWAQTPADSSLPWGPDRRQHIVSISKFITTMGLTHLLDAEGIDYNTPIISYLPDYWQTGAGVENITFAHLMNHRSGIVTGNNSDASYGRMRSLIAADVSNPGMPSGYSNANFALCRILMATMAGYIDTNADFGATNDLMWNWITILSYADYIEQNVFTPAGVNGPVLDNTSDSARAYGWNDTGTGWDSSETVDGQSGGTALFGQAGGVAWHMSPDELLDVVGEFRRGGGIVSPARAIEIFNASYGLNSPVNGQTSPAGRFYYKPGYWGTGSQAEQAFVMILPEQIEVAIFVSSMIGPNDASLQNLGRTLYLNNVIEP